MTSPDPTPRTAATVDGLLRQKLASGEWQLGAKIPNEMTLAAEFGVRKSVIRDAVRDLVHVGLLEARPGRGTFVAAFSELDLALQRRVTPEQIIVAFEAREALEIQAVRLAAHRLTDQQLAGIREILAARGQARMLAELTSLDIQFHRAIVAATANDLLMEMYLGLDIQRVFNFSSITTFAPEETLQHDHELVVDALARHDPELAARLVRTMLAEALSKTLG
ncbi:FadR/GntR family transcriptional regulator [Psychromicrobium xiongbiense]|uniref:FadR/GntR family transcriptional regulator n=1 Tax=Psychromicrobium xiongbiense TaxID=3051184 RepID=UPI002553264A|nr:FCD domain-containing protein [Psychromicrobium sp. YIM S02556]